MERAIHITNPDNLKFYTPQYNRIYFGTEFCQNLIPTAKDLKKVLQFSGKNALQFTFVTPFVTAKGLTGLERLLGILKTKQKKCEVVVNDWGVLELLSRKYKNFKPALGRLLTRQNRDPAMAKVLEKQLPYGVRMKDGRIRIVAHVPPGERYQKGIRDSYVNAPSIQKFLSGLSVERIELNNLIQGTKLDGLAFKVSLYTPFVNISTTRFCPMESRLQKVQRIGICKRECRKHYARLTNKSLRRVLYKRGNTTFYKNPVSLKALKNSSVDRIVFQPELPF